MQLGQVPVLRLCQGPLSGPFDGKIEWNLRMLGRLEPEKTRLFLLGENAFCLSFEQLSQIFSLAKTFMPNVREFAMYARIDDVLRKTPEELLEMLRRQWQSWELKPLL